MDIDDLRNEVSKIFLKSRNLFFNTGKGGAIEYDIQMRFAAFEVTHGREPNEEEANAIRDSVNPDDYEEGIYTVSPEGIRYDGLFDPEMKDGVYAIKSDGKFLIERWADGRRTDYKYIDEKEFNDLRNK